MGRTGRDKREPSRSRPPERIELNGEHSGRKLAIALVLLVLGVGMLVYAITGLLAPETGWQTIAAGRADGLSCGEEFTFLYESRSTAEAKQVTQRYTQLCRRAYQLFNSDQGFEGVTNLWEINRRPNQELEVDGVLYDALAALTSGGRRELYLGPVYIRYDDLFFCQDDAQLVDFDPRLSREVAEEYAAVLAFANDPQAIDLELLEENRICLRVSQAYLDYAQREGVERFIDFAWTRNAFITDFLAEELAAGGYTRGVISSYDGFTRNLDGRGTDYSYPLHQRTDEGVYTAGIFHYQGPMSLVCLRDYPTSELDLQRYYTLRGGEVRTMYLDPADALCKSAVSSLVCYGADRSCGELLLEMIPVYIADSFQPEAISRLAAGGIWSLTCWQGELLYSQPEAVLTDLYTGGEAAVTAREIR